jgi:serine/threonine protein kinase
MQWVRGRLIGKGSYGRVYHALNVEAGEWIAVKQVDIPTSSSDLQNGKLMDSMEALNQEIKLLSDLEHENVVQYLGYDIDQEEDHLYIFLEYVPGGSLASSLGSKGGFDVTLVKFFTRQILVGLEYLHDRNILHRVRSSIKHLSSFSFSFFFFFFFFRI